MPSNAVLREVQQLYKVSERLDLLAEEHPLISEALITISGKRPSHRDPIGSSGRDQTEAAPRT
jgi:hypothetical protein